MKSLDPFSRFRPAHRTDRAGLFVIQALAVSNGLQGFFQGDVVEVHRQRALHAVIDDKIYIP